MMIWLLLRLGDTEVVAPGAPGLEYTMPDNRLTYTIPINRLHYTMDGDE